MGPREWHRRCDPRVETGHRRLATLCSFNHASFDGDSYRLPLTGLDLFGHVKFGNGSPSSQPFAQRLRRHRGAIASIRLEDRLCAIRVENLACPGLIIRAAFLSFALRHVECRSSSNARATLTCPAAGNYPCRTLIEVGKHKLAIVRTRGSTFAKGFLLRSTLPSLPCRYTCIRSSLGGGNCTPGGDPFSRRLWRRNGSGNPAIVCSRDRRTALYSLSSDRIHTRGAVALSHHGKRQSQEERWNSQPSEPLHYVLQAPRQASMVGASPR